MKQAVHSWLTSFGGFVAASIADHWQSTLDISAVYYDTAVNPFLGDYSGPFIYLVWHEYLTFPLGEWKNVNATLLMSKHRDADVLAKVAIHAGYDVVRGSTNRGGVAAIRQLQRKSETMSLATTPDGPRGPRRRLAAGPIYLSSKLQMPLICIGIGYDRPWRMRTWDRFAIARPFSRARVISGPLMQIPPNIDRAATEHYRLRVERMMEFLTNQAETWAESGERLPGQGPFRPWNPYRLKSIGASASPREETRPAIATHSLHRAA